MKTVSLLIKPASGRCNLRCKYCFYEDVSEQRNCHDLGLMSEEILERMVSQAMETAEERVVFAFQGGEPMLRGLPFFQRFVELEEKYLRPSLQIEHAIQTNATLVDEEWAAFFRDHHFLVGVSLDGTRESHNMHRVDLKGKGSWDKCLRAAELLVKHGVEVNLLCVVTGQIARRAQAVYQNLKKLGFRYLQFIPCLDPLGEDRGNRPWSLRPERYVQFLCTLFDLWYRDWQVGDYVSIRLFDDYVHQLAGFGGGACATTGKCGEYFVVEGDGSVYPCDFFVLDEWRMGNLSETALDTLKDSPRATEFRCTGQGHPDECNDCPWLPLCNGGCRRDWVGQERNYHCAALKQFFEHAYPRLAQMADLERQCQEMRGHGAGL